jgi:hypothetical protein
MMVLQRSKEFRLKLTFTPKGTSRAITRTLKLKVLAAKARRSSAAADELRSVLATTLRPPW